MKKNKKKILLILGVIIFVEFLYFLYFLYDTNCDINKETNTIINEMKSLEEKLAEKSQQKGERHIVEGFELKKDTLPFCNFATVSSSEGNCEGYSVYEMFKFNGTLDTFLGENKKSNINKDDDLSTIILDEDDVRNVYSSGKYYYDFNRVKKEKNYEDIVKISNWRKKPLKIKKLEEDFKSKDFKNENFKNILEDISYLQDNKGYVMDQTEPYRKGVIISPVNKEQKYEEIDLNINKIKNKIDNGKLLVVAINNRNGGHALLVYGYEKLDNNNYKVYVKDSNIPYIKKDIITEEDRKKNIEIQENVYILFTKDILKSKWSYIYQPKLQDIDIYESFNSFVPNTKFQIIKE